MSKLYDRVDYNNLKFEYVGPTKDVSFYEHKDSKELFNAIKNKFSKFSEVMNNKNKFLNKPNNMKIGKKTIEQKGLITWKNFTNLEKKLLIFIENIYIKVI